jgi:membrane protein DedA with SNARE-associated domain
MPGNIVLESSKITILVIIFLAQALKEMGIPSLGLSHSLLLYAGYLFSTGNPYFGSLIVIFTFLGSFCGAFLVFYLARWRGDQLLAGMVRCGVINPESILKARRVLTTSSSLTISIGRTIPGLMVPTSILAGILDFTISSFLTGIVATLIIWVAVFVTMGTTMHFFVPHMILSPAHLLKFLGPFIVVGIFLGVLFTQQRKTNFRLKNLK